MTCAKKVWTSEARAKKAAITVASYQRGGKTRQRPYFCGDCKGWHLATGAHVARKDGKR